MGAGVTFKITEQQVKSSHKTFYIALTNLSTR